MCGSFCRAPLEARGPVPPGRAGSVGFAEAGPEAGTGAADLETLETSRLARDSGPVKTGPRGLTELSRLESVGFRHGFGYT